MADSPTRIIYDQRRPLLVVRATTLRVISGPDAGACCELGAKRLSVGTAPDNDLVLDDSGVSRHHLELQVRDRGYLVRDLDSTNGTYFRGARVREVLIEAAAQLRVGETVLRLDPGTERSDVIEARRSFGDLIGSSPPMQRVYGVLASVAPTDTTVLIEGETGTGKELVAEALHRASPRRAQLFSVLDCGALPAELIESELFGHEKGAFTGASDQRIGVFERTRGGTVFLDEIGELPLELQTRLLRVLDRRTIRRVGGDHPRSVDVRLVAATNRRLKREVAAGRFREDLYYRLSVVRLELPPLRKRKEDIPLLARHFLLQAGSPDPDSVLSDQLLEVLCARRWPGNVRELRNIVERAMLLGGGDGDERDRLLEEEPTEPSTAKRAAPADSRSGGRDDERSGDAVRPRDGWLASAMPPSYMQRPYRTARELLLQQFDTLYLGRLVEEHGHNVSAIARAAGLDRHVTRRLLRKHGLYPDR